MLKNIIRVISLTVLLCMILSACSVQSADSYDKNDKYTDDVVTGSGTFSGTFRIKTEAKETLSLDPTVSGSTVRGDEILQRYSEIEDKYDCTVTAEQVKSGVIMTTMMASTAAARTFADIFQLSASGIFSMYKGGYLTYAQNLSGIDVSSEKWGSDGAKEMMTFEDGKTYGIRNAYWAAPIQSVSGVLYYNDDLIVKNNVVSPYEYYENGKWNWNNFEDICLAVTQTIEDKQSTYAFARPTSDYPAFIYAALASNGSKRLEKTSSGYKCTYTDEKTLKAFDWMKKLVIEDKVSYTLREDELTDLDVEAFTNFYTVFLVGNSSIGISDDETYPLYTFGENFRWIEFPKGPDFEGKTSAYYSADDWFIAFSNTIDTDKGGNIVNDLFEPLGDENSDDWKYFISRNYFFYDGDYDIFENMLTNAKSDYSVLTQNSILAETDIFAAIVDGVKTPIEGTTMISTAIEELAG